MLLFAAQCARDLLVAVAAFRPELTIKRQVAAIEQMRMAILSFRRPRLAGRGGNSPSYTPVKKATVRIRPPLDRKCRARVWWRNQRFETGATTRIDRKIQPEYA